MRYAALQHNFTILEHLYKILCDFLRDLVHFENWLPEKNVKYKNILWLMNLSSMPECLISYQASVASEKI